MLKQAAQAGGCTLVAAVPSTTATPPASRRWQTSSPPTRTLWRCLAASRAARRPSSSRGEQAPLHAGNLLRASLQRFGGGGGGGADFAQGGGVAPEQLGELLDYAVQQARAELAGKGAA